MRTCSLIALATFALSLRTTIASDELTPEQSAEGWVLLFDGKSLAGWEPTGDADWQVVDGEIRVTKGEQGFLMAAGKYRDFELHVEFKAPATTNSGVFLRTPLAPQDPARDCVELNIAPEDNPFPTGSLVGRLKVDWAAGEVVRSASELNLHETFAAARKIKPWDGRWHAFDVKLSASSVRVAIDGWLPTIYLFGDWSGRGSPEGDRIGLQFREGPAAFRNVRVRVH